MNLLHVVTELAAVEASVMGTGWRSYHRLPPPGQRDAWHPPAVAVDQVLVQYEATLSQALVTVDLLFVAGASGTDTAKVDEQIYSVASTGVGGLAEQLAAVQSPNGLWTDISAETARITYREIGQNTYLVAVLPVQLLCPHTPTPPA